MAVILSVASLCIAVGVWVVYMATVPSGRVPVRPVAHVVAMVAAIVASTLGLAITARNGSSFAVVGPTAGFGLMMSGLFLWVLSLRKTPIGDLRVRVGEKLLPFSATTPSGAAFRTDEWAGQRILLKFFRGSW